jgi:hypothetical protein
MTEPNYRGIIKLLGASAILVILLALMVSTSGCVTSAKEVYKGLTATPVPTTTPPTPEPTPIPTVPPTPAAIETLAAHYVDPFAHGERWEDQWFEWERKDVQGINGEGTKDLLVGVVCYRHAFLDYYTWWNAALGNYMVQKPGEGNRYFVAWVHEEMLGNDSSYDPSMWIFDEEAFRLQVRDTLYSPDLTHNPVNRIRELDRQYDFYDTTIAGPFAWKVRYSGYNPETAGYIAERIGWLRLGRGNAVDGYILFEIPKDTMEDEIALLGSFSRFGSAYWKFTR